MRLKLLGSAQRPCRPCADRLRADAAHWRRVLRCPYRPACATRWKHRPWYVLIDISSSRSAEDARATIEAILVKASRPVLSAMRRLPKAGAGRCILAHAGRHVAMRRGRRRIDQARYFRARCKNSRVHRARPSAVLERHPRRADCLLRPYGRRQSALQYFPACRRRQGSFSRSLGR